MWVLQPMYLVCLFVRGCVHLHVLVCICMCLCAHKGENEKNHFFMLCSFDYCLPVLDYYSTIISQRTVQVNIKWCNLNTYNCVNGSVLYTNQIITKNWTAHFLVQIFFFSSKTNMKQHQLNVHYIQYSAALIKNHQENSCLRKWCLSWISLQIE